MKLLGGRFRWELSQWKPVIPIKSLMCVSEKDCKLYQRLQPNFSSQCFYPKRKRGLWIHVNTRCVDAMPGAHAQDVLNVIVKLQACYKTRFSSHKPNSVSLLKRFICRLPRFGNDSCAGDRQQTPPEKPVNCAHKWQTVPCCTYK